MGNFPEIQNSRKHHYDTFRLENVEVPKLPPSLVGSFNTDEWFRVYINGLLIDNKKYVNQKEIIENWVNYIAHVPQRVYLSEGTIESNILFGIEKTDENIKKLDLWIISYYKYGFSSNFSIISNYMEHIKGFAQSKYLRKYLLIVIFLRFGMLLNRSLKKFIYPIYKYLKKGFISYPPN